MIVGSFSLISPGASIMTIFLREHLGASPSMIGLNVALFTLGPLLSVVGAPLFDAVERRRRLWVIMTTIGRCAFLPIFLAPILAVREELRPLLTYMVISAGAIAMAINGISSVGWWSWMADLIPESIRGRFFGERTRFLLIVAAIVPLAAGGALDLLPERSVMIWIFLMATIMAILQPLLHLWIPEPQRGMNRQKPSLRTTVRMYMTPLRDRGFRAYLGAVGFRVFAASLPAPFLVLYLRGEIINGQLVGCEATYFMITLASAIGVGAGVISSRWWGMLADKIGHRPVFLIGIAGYVLQLCYGLLSPDNYSWLLPLLNVFGNLIGVGTGIAMSNLLIGISPKEGREYYVATYTVMVSLPAALAPWLGGLIGQRWPILPITMLSGQPATYYHLLIILSLLITLPSIMLTLRIPEARGDDVGISLLRLARGGLIRIVHQLGIISQTDDPLRRARTIGAMRGASATIAVDEISEALGDPSPQVRQAALLALGRLGSEQSLEILMWWMHEPDADSRETAATALGEISGPAGVFLLINALSDPDARVRRAAAISLGRHGDSTLGPTLKRRLDEDPDVGVQVAAGRGLSYLKDYDAIPALAAFALSHSSQIARLEMTIALGGLFGSPREFYRLWARNRRVPGAQFSKLIAAASRRLKWRLRAAHRAKRLSRARFVDFQRDFKIDRGNLQSFAELRDWDSSLAVIEQMLIRVMSIDDVEARDDVAACHRFVRILRESAEAGKGADAAWDGLTLAALYGTNCALSRDG
jgi:MFS family permease